MAISLPEVVEPIQKEEVKQAVEQVIAPEPVDDPNFCNIEETIDECERRIKAEEARYAKLLAHRHHYEQWLHPVSFKLLMREAATRLVNFDPVFDLPSSACPLPRPWDQHRQSRSHHQFSGQSATSYVVPAEEFAYPKPPRRSHY
jgi:hypothetical protein